MRTALLAHLRTFLLSLDSRQNLGKISGMKLYTCTRNQERMSARNRGEGSAYALSCLRACALFLLLAGCAGLRSLLSSPERTSWFPLSVGNRWDYRLVSTVEENGRLDTTTIADYHHVITGTRKLAGGQPAFIRVWTSNVTLLDSGTVDSSFSQTETTYFRRSNRWVYRYQALGGAPDSILALPPEMDQKWRSGGLYYWVAAREDVIIGDEQYPGAGG